MKLNACKKKWHGKTKAMLIFGSLLLLPGCVHKIEMAKYYANWAGVGK